jgi:hypothetical protein
MNGHFTTGRLARLLLASWEVETERGRCVSEVYNERSLGYLEPGSDDGTRYDGMITGPIRSRAFPASGSVFVLVLIAMWRDQQLITQPIHFRNTAAGGQTLWG